MIDALLLSRLQFAWVISLHILLPAFTVGLASYIAVLEGAYFFTRQPVFLRLSKYWLRIFALSFGLGVVSGIVMSFQFGINWSRYSDLTADIVGPLLAYEVLTAFFLEAGFLGVLLFGRERWFGGEHPLWLWPVPLLTFALFALLWRSLARGRDATPLFAALGIFAMAYLGLGISIFPMVVPYRFELWQAAAGPESQTFLMIGTIFMLPILLGYTAFSYWVFRGKVKAGSGYH